jgi:hypothetical protein
MRASAFALLLMPPLCAPGASLGAPTCPPSPLGVHVEQVNGKRVVKSVAREELPEEGELETALAAGLAELEAKALLAGKPTEAAAQLSGVVRDFVCTAQGFVYVGVKRGSEQAQQASTLRRAMGDSLRSSPTPGAEAPGRPRRTD